MSGVYVVCALLFVATLGNPRYGKHPNKETRNSELESKVS